MDSRLIQTHTQKLILAPQLRLFLKLLELPVFELTQRIEQELAENPVLEEVSPSADSELSEDLNLNETAQDANNESAEALLNQDNLEALEREENSELIDFSQSDARDLQKKRDYQESILSKPSTLSDYLEWQLSILDFTESEKEIAKEIIGNINDDGYLKVTVEELSEETKASTDEVLKVLNKIQAFDPPGVGGRNLQEVLLLQLKRSDQPNALAERMVQDHFPMLEKKQFDLLARSLKVSSDAIAAAVKQITKLEPKPGRIYYSEKPNYVIPDAVISIHPNRDEELVIELSNERIPELRVSAMYKKMMKEAKTDPKTKLFLKEKMQAALDLIRSLSQRKSTMRQITEELVSAQKEFFLKGFAYLKPLRLKDIAGKIGVHESTVSRAIHGKYLETPFGTIPYKSFFSSKLEMEDGSVESQKSVLERMKRLIESEDKGKPFSDSKIVKLLTQEGINISRRTVAKYRERLQILPTYLRKTR